MLLAALRDMQWRKRRFVIAILSTSIIFAMTLVLTGLANGFRVEAEKTVDSLGVDVFLVKAGASGPFVGATPFAPVDLRGSPRPLAWTRRLRSRTPAARPRSVIRRAMSTYSARRSAGPACPPCRRAGHRRPRTRSRCRARSDADRRRRRNRFAQTAHRRHRGELHGAGEPAQRLSHHTGRATTGVRRSTAGRHRSASAAPSGRYPTVIGPSTEQGRSPICSGR